jgi:hypothetical protein
MFLKVEIGRYLQLISFLDDNWLGALGNRTNYLTYKVTAAHGTISLHVACIMTTTIGSSICGLGDADRFSIEEQLDIITAVVQVTLCGIFSQAPI